jgi:LysM repeat protein
VPAENLRKWNHLKGNTLTAGHVLLIHRPVAGSGHGTQSSASSKSKHTGADRPSATSHGKPATSPSLHAAASRRTDLAGAKSMGKNSSAKSASGKPASGHQIVHRVTKGETLGSIAHTYKVSVSELKRNNGKLAENLRPGTTLVIKRAE